MKIDKVSFFCVPWIILRENYENPGGTTKTVVEKQSCNFS